MSRYAQRSKISKYLTRAEVDEKSARRSQFGPVVFDKTVKALERLALSQKAEKEKYNKVKDYLNKSGDKFDSKPLMPDYNKFIRGYDKNVMFGDIPVSIDQLEQISYVDDPKAVELSNVLLDTKIDSFINEIRGKLDLGDNNGKP